MLHGDLLGERARLTPDGTALVEVATGRRFTYAELDARAIATARCLQAALGLAAGDRIGLLAGNSVEFLDLFFAVPKTGVILVPLSTRLTARELAFVIHDSGIRALVYDRTTCNTVRDLRHASAPPAGGGVRPRGVRPPAAALGSDPGGPERGQTPDRRGGVRPPAAEVGSDPGGPAAAVGVEQWITIDEPAVDGDDVLGDLVSASSSGRWSPARPHPEDPYCLLYTSGTTGQPKGVIVPHRMIAWNGYNTVVGWQLQSSDVSPLFTPLYHAGALGAFLVPIFTIGGTIVLHRGFDASEIWRTIEQERCTVVLGVPTIWKLLMEAPEFGSVDLSHVRWFISGGAPLPEYLIDAYQRRGVVFKQGYGLTEVGVNCFAMTVEDSVRKKGSIGKPLMFTETRIVGEDGRDVPDDDVGELWLKGPHVSRGYWNNPDATAAALDADGFFHTGDLARRDREGFHYIAGRRKDMFISGGVNVYPAEIEGELLLHADVQDAAVIGVPDATWGEVGVAFVVARPGRTPSPDELTRHLEGRLARYKIPKTFLFVDALPRTPYGKVVKTGLARAYAERAGSPP